MSVPLFDPMRYAEAVKFATERHAAKHQRVPGTQLPYVAHITWVTAEVMAALPSTPNVDGDLAVLCAILHDTIEDTDTTHQDVSDRFGKAVADGVQALSKAPAPKGLTGAEKLAYKRAQMEESLTSIRQQPHAVWMVKLADRITNLAPPPTDWSIEKRRAYREEAIVIADRLAGACLALDAKIRERIRQYVAFC